MSAIGWEYFFAGPGGMSILIAACLVAALFGLGKKDQPDSRASALNDSKDWVTGVSSV